MKTQAREHNLHCTYTLRMPAKVMEEIEHIVSVEHLLCLNALRDLPFYSSHLLFLPLSLDMNLEA